MQILEKLRAETATHHDTIEKNPLLSRLTKNLSLTEYIYILKKFYGFYLPFENFLNWAEIELLTQMKLAVNRQKAPLLKQDLQYFDVAVDQIPISPIYPRPLSYPAVLGCFYVLEGSCLGRKMMWPRLSAKLHLQSNQGGAFFYDCGDGIKKIWTDYCDMLNSKICKESEEKDCIHAAIQTFENIDVWFKTLT